MSLQRWLVFEDDDENEVLNTKTPQLASATLSKTAKSLSASTSFASASRLSLEDASFAAAASPPPPPPPPAVPTVTKAAFEEAARAAEARESALVSEKNELYEMIDQLKKENEALRAAAMAAKIDASAKKHAHHRVDQTATQKTIATLNTKIADLGKELAQEKKKYDSLQSRYNAVKSASATSKTAPARAAGRPAAAPAPQPTRGGRPQRRVLAASSPPPPPPPKQAADVEPPPKTVDAAPEPAPTTLAVLAAPASEPSPTVHAPSRPAPPLPEGCADLARRPGPTGGLTPGRRVSLQNGRLFVQVDGRSVSLDQWCASQLAESNTDLVVQ